MYSKGTMAGVNRQPDKRRICRDRYKENKHTFLLWVGGSKIFFRGIHCWN